MITTVHITQGEITQITNPRDWRVGRDDNGTIHASCQKEYDDGSIESSFVELSPIQGQMVVIVTLDGRPELRMRRKIPRTPIDGVLGLSGGRIRDRYAFYRDKKYSDWLVSMGLTQVKAINPNTVYSGILSAERSFIIETDGVMETVDITPGSNLDGYEKTKQINVQIEEATWVIVKKSAGNGSYVNNTLFTRRPLYSIRFKDEMRFSKDFPYEEQSVGD